jgi:hypothetical protein
MFYAMDINNLINAVNTMRDEKEIKQFIFNYFYSLKNKHKEYITEGKCQIYNVILTHPNFNDLKNTWLPIPLNEELKKYIRIKTISDII